MTQANGMTKALLKPLALFLAMAIAAGMALAARPTAKLAEQGPKVELETMIPKQFGDWRIDETIVPVQPAPEVQAKLDKIYNQTLARTYVNSHGQRVMLSIAYGGDQSDSMHVHKPEICYAAQGFQIMGTTLGQIATEYGYLPAKRLVATMGSRIEPVTYWITVGDEVVDAGYKWKLAQLKYGLTGRVPDGMLVRASSIDRDEKMAYALQDSFLREMVSAMPEADRVRIAGHSGA